MVCHQHGNVSNNTAQHAWQSEPHNFHPLSHATQRQHAVDIPRKANIHWHFMSSRDEMFPLMNTHAKCKVDPYTLPADCPDKNKLKRMPSNVFVSCWFGFLALPVPDRQDSPVKGPVTIQTGLSDIVSEKEQCIDSQNPILWNQPYLPDMNDLSWGIYPVFALTSWLRDVCLRTLFPHRI